MTDPLLPGVSISDGPADWQIIQQGADGTADIALAGAYRVDAAQFAVELRLVRERDGTPVSDRLDWQAVDMLPGDRWQGVLRGVPAGGLYRVECRATRPGHGDPRPTRGDYVHHLGVGDIWVIAGQSNSSGTGLGAVDDPPTLGVHLFGNDEQWKLAAHPLEDATRTLHPITVHGVFQAHAPWLAFGRVLQETLGYPIGLIPTALGGSPLSMWEPAQRGLLYTNMMQMIRAAGGAVRGMVWCQGESDAIGLQTGTYLDRFAAFLATWREEMGAELPVLTAQLSRYTVPVGDEVAASWTALREVQRQAARHVPGVGLVPTVDLPMSDEVHISAVGNVVMGRRFAAAALRYVYGRDEPAPGVRLVGVAWQSAQPPVLRVTFAPPLGGWRKVPRVRDFTVSDADGPVPVMAAEALDDGWVDLELGRATVGEVTVTNHAGCDPVADLRDMDQRPTEGFTVALPPA